MLTIFGNKRKREMGRIFLQHIWEWDIYGRNLHQLTDGVHYSETEPAWSSGKALEIGKG